MTYPWRFEQTALRAALDGAIARHRPDRALVWPGAEAQWFGRRDLPPAVMDMIDCNTLEFCRSAMEAVGLRRRAYRLREAAIATVYTARTLRSFGATVCVGEQDARWLRPFGPRARVHVVPNGVEIPADAPGEDPAPTLSFVGTLNYAPNVHAALYAAEAIWPRIRAAVPEAKFVIAGRDPVAAVSELARQPGIEIRANVADMAEVLGRSWVSIAPMRSGVGIKNKVLEAWACGRPVVLTPLATNGLQLPEGHRALVHTSADGLAASVIALLTDPAARRALGRSALASVRANATWAAAAARIDTLLRDLLPRPP
jgi:polysaccharide biosynthesis protein PslH